jgi:hypothetical protein
VEPELLDCHWCGSARSIEFGICQVCLMEYPVDTRVIQLPTERPERVIELESEPVTERAAGD